MKLCSIDGCGNPYHAHGLCCTHAHRKARGRPEWTWRELFIRENPPKNGVGLIPLTRGAVALVDDSDYGMLMQYVWHLAVRGDVCANVGGGKQLKMHRLLMNAPPDRLVNHINLNPLDNRRANLRLATKMQNAANSRHTRSSSGYRGVYHDRNNGKYRAYIAINHKRQWIGPGFGTAERAALARDIYAAPIVGAFYRPSLEWCRGEGYDIPVLNA